MNRDLCLLTDGVTIRLLELAQEGVVVVDRLVTSLSEKARSFRFRLALHVAMQLGPYLHLGSCLLYFGFSILIRRRSMSGTCTQASRSTSVHHGVSERW